ncbi:YchJ family protein [Micrococcus sp.]|uniref:YchJ family protein n=1 Tax=Micrococcus sp. TaxID=1271 RepID=UPI0034A191DF
MDGTLAAPTAEDLMRSRYTAFARLGAADPTSDDGARTVTTMVAYLRATWAAETRPSAADLTPAPDDPATCFTRLAVTDTTSGGPFDTVGTVIFTALGRDASGGRVRLTERSRFRREDGVWCYVAGDVAG